MPPQNPKLHKTSSSSNLHLRLRYNIETLLNEDGQVNQGDISRTLGLERFEEHLSSEEGQGLIDDVLALTLELWGWALGLRLNWTKTESASCLDTKVLGKGGMVCHQGTLRLVVLLHF